MNPTVRRPGDGRSPAVLRVLAAAVLLGVLVLWADLLRSDVPRAGGATQSPTLVVAGVVPAVLGAWLCSRRPSTALPWLVLLCGVLLTLSAWGPAWGRAHPGQPAAVLTALTAGLYLPSLLLPVTLVLLRYPGGVVVGRWRQALDRALVVGLVAVGVAFAISPQTVSDELPGQQQPFAVSESLALTVAVPGLVVVLGGAGVVVLDAVARAARARGADRVALAWLLTTAVVFALSGLVVDGVAVVEPVPVLAVWGAFGYGVLRHRALDIDVVVRRGLVLLVLTGLVLLLLVVGTAASVRLVPRASADLVVAVVVVAVLLPARDLVQRLVDRVLYGERTDPWAAMRELARGPEEDQAPRDRITTVVGGLVRSLRVPSAHLLDRSGGVVASAGEPTGAAGEPARVALTLAGSTSGHLVVAPRAGEARLGRADRAFLEALAPLLAAVLEADELGEEVRRERNRVLDASSAERRRIRRELHDGLGPSLTGIGLGLEALARPDLGADQCESLLSRLRDETASALAETRRVIEDLGPGVLDDLDLVSALRRRGEQVSAVCGLEVVVQGPDRWPVLPQQVTSALYRVADEALVNVVRHARASRCVVRLAYGSTLHLSVLDDGVGPGAAGARAPEQTRGVGLESMRERVADLGGTLEVCAAGPGTRLVVEVPR